MSEKKVSLKEDVLKVMTGMKPVSGVQCSECPLDYVNNCLECDKLHSLYVKKNELFVICMAQGEEKGGQEC